MWLGLSDRDIERGKRRRRIEASGECLGLGCERFQAFLRDVQVPSDEATVFELNAEQAKEVRRINQIDDEAAMMAALHDMFRGLGQCPVYMATKDSLAKVVDKVPLDDCVGLSTKVRGTLPLVPES